MATDQALARSAGTPAHGWYRVPPAGERYSLDRLRALLRTNDPDAVLRQELGSWLECDRLSWHRSGREALRVAFLALAAKTGRREVVVPAYTCFSVPAAAVAAGLRVRLVDVDSRGWIDPAALARVDLSNAAAIVICNLFGFAEPAIATREMARAAGCGVVDDAAQAYGATARDGRAGGRGDVGILSFGRGKPLSGLGGGAVVWSQLDPPETHPAPPVRRSFGILQALGYNAALSPWIFGGLASIPWLEIGQTPYDTEFPRGAIRGDHLGLAASRARDARERGTRRRERALDLANRAGNGALEMLLDPSGGQGVFPRLFGLAEDRDAAADFLARWGKLGASRLYPSSLEDVGDLQSQLAHADACPGARTLADRVISLPTHPGGGEDSRRFGLG